MAKRAHRFYEYTTVRTAPELLVRSEFLGPKAYRDARRPSGPGLITGTLGRWYLVLHEDLTTAIYNEAELQPEPAAYWRVTHTVQGVSYFKEIGSHAEVQSYMASLDDGVTAKAEGPFYSDKELTEGPLETRTLFDHLTDEL